MYSITVDISDT